MAAEHPNELSSSFYDGPLEGQAPTQTAQDETLADMRRREDNPLKLGEPTSVDPQAATRPRQCSEAGSIPDSAATSNFSEFNTGRRASFLIFEDDSDLGHDKPFHFESSLFKHEEEDIGLQQVDEHSSSDPSMLAAAQSDAAVLASSPTPSNCTTLAAASNPATPVSPETMEAQQEEAVLTNAAESSPTITTTRALPTALMPGNSSNSSSPGEGPPPSGGPTPPPLRLSPSLSSIPETGPSPNHHQQQQQQQQQQHVHNHNLPLARRPSATLSARGHSYVSGDWSYNSAWATPALTTGSSSTSVSSRPPSSAFFTDADGSNRISIASFGNLSTESPSLETVSSENKPTSSPPSFKKPATQQQKYQQQEQQAPASSSHHLEVLTIDPDLAAAGGRHSSPLPSPSRIGLGLTTDESEMEQPGPLVRQNSNSSSSPSLSTMNMPGAWSQGGRQRTSASAGLRSRSSSVAERVERARMSSANNSNPGKSPNAAGSAVSSPGNIGAQRVIGLKDVSPDTAWWILRGVASEDATRGLNSMMGLTHLTVLDISHCGLNELPLAISSFQALKALDISSNKIARKTLPAFLSTLPYLEKLIADCCGLYSLYHSLAPLSNLSTFSLQDNHLTSLPAWLSQLDQLKDLRLDGNPLHGVFADLVKPLLTRAPMTPRQRVSSVSSLATSMFDAPPQRSQVTSPVVSPKAQQAALAPEPSASRTDLPISSSVRPSPTPEKEKAFDTGKPPSSSSSNPPSRPPSSHESQYHPSFMQSIKSLRKMKSSEDVGHLSPDGMSFFGLHPHHENKRRSITDISSSFMSGQHKEPPPPAPSAPVARPPTPPSAGPSMADSMSSKKRPGNFFRKMSSFGRTRKESQKDLKQARPPLPSDFRPTSPETPPQPQLPDAASPPPPAVPPKNDGPSQQVEKRRSRTTSNASAQSKSDYFGSNNKQHPMLSPMPTGAYQNGLVVAQNGEIDDVAEEIFEQSFESNKTSAISPSPSQQKAAGLQALLAYLKDLNDLSLRDQSGPPKAAQPRPGVTRRPTSAGDSSRDGFQADSETSRLTQYSATSSSTDSAPVPMPPAPPAEIKLKDDLVKRERVLSEIVSTEKTYVTALQELIDIYVVPSGQIAKGVTGGRETVIPQPERKAVFSNIENLLQFHARAFLPDLEAAIAPLNQNGQSGAQNGALLNFVAEEVARVFVRHGAFMRMYHIYVNNFDAALVRCRGWTAGLDKSTLGTPRLNSSASSTSSSTSNSKDISTDTLSTTQKKRMKKFFDQCKSDPRHSQINCESYLLLPIQRIPRYKLLLESLQSCTPVFEPSGTKPHPTVSAALELVGDLTTDLNEKKRESEGRTRLLQWQARINCKFRSPLVQPHRLLLRESKMTLSRVVKRCTDFASAPPPVEGQDDGAVPSMFQIESLKIEEHKRPLIGLLSTDILVLVADSGESTGPVDLFTVIRLGSSPSSLCAVITGMEGRGLRILDPQRAILYLELASPAEAQTWASMINQQAVIFS